jgi:hypothetical protein
VGKPVKLNGSAKPYSLIAYSVGVGLPLVMAVLADGGPIVVAVVAGGTAGLISAVFGPRRLELRDRRVRVLGGFVRMRRVLAEGSLDEVELGERARGLRGTLRGHQVDLRDESVWLSERTWGRLQEAVRRDRLRG